MVLLGGCEAGRPQTETAKTARIDTRDGMIKYLEGLNLPALKSVNRWQNEYGPGLRLVTEHYEILTTLLEPLMLSQVPGFMESCYRGYQGQLPKPIATRTKFRVYLFAQRKQWENFTKSFTGGNAPMYSKIKAGAYYLDGVCVSYNIGRERTFAVLGHEGWHQFNDMSFKYRLPSWLNEGIAMLFEANRYEQGLFYFDHDKNMYRLASLKNTLAKNKMIPLQKLISMNPGEALATNQDDMVMAFYSQVYALVRFLREDGYGKRLGNYHQMLMGGLRGDWPLGDERTTIAADRNIPLTVRWNRIVGTQLFELYIGDNFSQLEREYTAYCRKIVYRIRLK